MSYRFDAADIEYAFARVVGNEIGERGTEHDADYFRSGKPEYLSGALTSVIDAIEERMNNIDFLPTDNEPGEIGAQLRVAMSRLRKVVLSMEQSTKEEPNDYHWSIVAGLLTVINTLLVVAERKA